MVLLISTGVSCVSIRKNYLSQSPGKGRVCIPEKLLPEKEKLLQQLKADSLVQIISEKKESKKHIPAQVINQLYTSFGDRLNNDRYYQDLLLKQALDPDSLSAEQYLATLQLLSSATGYERSYQKNKMVRRSLNRGDSGNNIPKRILKKCRNFLYAPSVRKKLENQRAGFDTPETDSLLHSLPRTNTWKAFRYRFFGNSDGIHSLFYQSAFAGSQFFGNTIGMFYRLTDQRQNADLLLPLLQPFDLILVKSAHHLTDRFIPGYFGHVGIWLGQELTSRLKQGLSGKTDSGIKTTVEALRSGVQTSTLEEFADGEIFLVIRPRKLTNQQSETIISNIGKQLSKGYDFNFDIESPETITCTELIYLAYDFVDWKTRYTWSRYTLSPDDLVSTALDDSRFEFPVLVKNGQFTFLPADSLIRSLINVTGSPVNH